jgi:predicted signal transduction protein with EAL and GGDEF domain
MSVKARMGEQTRSKILSNQEASEKLLKTTECDLENRQAIEKALQHPAAQLPPQFETHFYQHQNLHQRRYLRQVNYIGQMTFLLYFFIDYFIIPDVTTLSATLRLSAVVLALIGNYFCFKLIKDIRLLDLILPVSATLCCGIWFYILSQSQSPWISTYVYASVIFVLMANLCIQVRFRPAVYNSLVMSVLMFLGVISLTNLQDALVFMVVYIPVCLLSLYISWINTLNARHHFLRSLLDDWNFHTLQALAHTDELTQLNNRRQFVHMAEHKIHAWPKSESVCLLMFDVDFFKQINDTYGHDIGDRVLKILQTLLVKKCAARIFWHALAVKSLSLCLVKPA